MSIDNAITTSSVEAGSFEELVALGLANELPKPAEKKEPRFANFKARVADVTYDVLKVSVTPVTKSAAAVGAVSGLVAKRVDDAISVHTSKKTFKATQLVPEGKSIREQMKAAREAAKLAHNEAKKGGE
jgi:hypothetical protein